MESPRSLPGVRWFLVLCLLPWSCSNHGDGPEFHRVDGRVTLDGEPLAGARILFTPVTGGRPSFGMTDDAGRYKLAYSSAGVGTPAGEYSVFISTYRAEEEDADTGGTIPSSPETVPVNYNRDTTLRVSVPGGEYDFELKSDGEIVQPASETGR